MEFIDIGINLAHDFDADREVVIQRAQAVGLVQMIVTGSSDDSTRKAIVLAKQQARPVSRRLPGSGSLTPLEREPSLDYSLESGI